jgi:hypothetical protein
MADFLNRLAARALGATPLAEPVIPTLFSSGPEQSAFLASDSASPPTRPAPETYAEASEDRPLPPHSRDADPGFETVVDRHVLPFQDMDEHPHRPLSQRPSVSPPQSTPALFAERETVQPSPEHAEARRQHVATAMGPPLSEVERPVAYRPQTTSPAQVPFAEPQPAPRLPRHAEPMRSQALQRPELPQAFRPAPPTVHVSIGRIEVRAEITSPAPAPRVQRPRPSTLSLDQFLKQAGKGTR